MDGLQEKNELFLMQQAYSVLTALTIKLDKQNKHDFKELSSRQYFVIVSILHLPRGKTSLTDIAKMLGTSKQSINKLLVGLKKKGYVNVKENEADKRRQSIDITDAGIKAMLTHAEQRIPLLKKFFSEFAEEDLSVLLRLLSKLYMFDGVEYNNIEKETNEMLENNYAVLLNNSSGNHKNTFQ